MPSPAPPHELVRKGRYDTILGGAGACHFGNYLACLLPPGFHFSREILFSLLAQELGRALAEFRIVRQPIERILARNLRVSGLHRSRLAPDGPAGATGRDHRRARLRTRSCRVDIWCDEVVSARPVATVRRNECVAAVLYRYLRSVLHTALGNVASLTGSPNRS
jgi:hypothetical protein